MNQAPTGRLEREPPGADYRNRDLVARGAEVVLVDDGIRSDTGTRKGRAAESELAGRHWRE